MTFMFETPKNTRTKTKVPRIGLRRLLFLKSMVAMVRNMRNTNQNLGATC